MAVVAVAVAWLGHALFPVTVPVSVSLRQELHGVSAAVAVAPHVPLPKECRMVPFV